MVYFGKFVSESAPWGRGSRFRHLPLLSCIAFAFPFTSFPTRWGPGGGDLRGMGDSVFGGIQGPRKDRDQGDDPDETGEMTCHL